MHSSIKCSSVNRRMINWRRHLYTLLFYLLVPLLLMRLWWRGRKASGYRERWWQRFGFVAVVDAPDKPKPLWIHAVSVGETIAIAPLVERLLGDYPALPIIITSMTPTGAERVQALFGERVLHYYCPYDLPDVICRFLARVKPRGCLIVETELWPNMIAGCQRAGVPVMVANARLSERSAKGYLRLAGLAKQMLSGLTLLVTQHQSDADRFQQLGMPADKILVSGSIKFDIEIDAASQAQGRLLRQELGNRFTVILASSHEDEEDQLLATLSPLWSHYPDLLIMIVPRHPERFESVCQTCFGYSANVVRRSEMSRITPGNTTRIYLGDTMGDLMKLYAAADVAVMGGSFSNVGGHNPLEPAVLGLPVIMGPHYFNFSAISDAMTQAGGMLLVPNMAAVAELLPSFVEVPSAVCEAGAKAASYADSQRGALDRLYQEVTARLL
ncbi:3-deoxy-D-manno-octulosonic-acid transferase [Neptunomonas antarctica]|uniref:3-deoxy-D-manno-octulosonic acid transferase n=2 Tax=Neptunomonas antarctica TaxID=619304 RepID=A0A1N7J108_9GAMM|nr:3-deoxy-D-manno-octulosonic-acid transferase [Neptunomonas antarctica]